MSIVNYQGRVNGGSPVDLGNVAVWLKSSLADNTSYLFEIRAEDDEGNFSAWSPITARTIDPATGMAAYKVNSGGSAERGWVADTGYTAPGSVVHDFADNTLHTQGPGFWRGTTAPEDFGDETVYRYLRYNLGGSIRYDIEGFVPSTPCLVRVHIRTNSSFPINQTITINGDLVKAAYASPLESIAVEQFLVDTDSSGNLHIVLDGTVLRAGVSGIEVRQPRPQESTVLICSGDSITDTGSIVGETHTWPAQIAGMYGGSVSGHWFWESWSWHIGYFEDADFLAWNIAASGSVISQSTTWVAQWAPAFAEQNWDRQIAFLLSGANDLVNGSGITLAQMKTNVAAWKAALPANITHCGIGTITQFDNSRESDRIDFNTWILANSLGFDFVCDFDAAMPDRNNLAYFQPTPDGGHPTILGCTVRANLVKAAIDAL